MPKGIHRNKKNKSKTRFEKKEEKLKNFQENWKLLPKEIREKILCETLTEYNVLEIYKILGKNLQYCKNIDWEFFLYCIEYFLWYNDERGILSRNFVKDFKEKFNWNEFFELYDSESMRMFESIAHRDKKLAKYIYENVLPENRHFSMKMWWANR